MRVEVESTGLEAGGPLWRDARCRYAYVDADGERLLYVGMADFQTVRQRRGCRGKDDLFEYFRRDLRGDAFSVMQGRQWPDEERRLTSEWRRRRESTHPSAPPVRKRRVHTIADFAPGVCRRLRRRLAVRAAPVPRRMTGAPQ